MDPVTDEIVSESGYSWFFTVVPVATEVSLPVGSRRMFNVSVVVCYRRNFQVYDPLSPPSIATTNTQDGEHVATIDVQAATGFPGMGLGGGNRLLLDQKVNVKENQWVMLYHVDTTTAGTT